MHECDTVIIGAGIAGASAAYELSRSRAVSILEREAQPGYHTTGRSAAVFSEIYGNAVIRGLTVGSRPFFAAPPDGFAGSPLWRSRPAIMIGRADQTAALDGLHAEAVRLVPTVRRLDAAEVRRAAPMLRPDYVAGGVIEPGAQDLDVDAIHRGFLRGAAANGARLVCDAEVRAIGRSGRLWRVATPAGEFAAPLLVNAAGAWCDEVARLAGAAPIGLVPKRRTVILFAPEPPTDVRDWPVVIDVAEQFYFKPDAGKLLGSPADETPSPPCDAQPEEMDIALAVDRIERAASFRIRRIEHKWAGLRSFVADKTPVVGFDDRVEGFFWLAGQGGYGIQTSPAMGRLAAALAAGEGVPADLATLGVDAAALSPRRLR
jgi:D-arginine dehydrogenase